jgi:hypothetical protein
LSRLFSSSIAFYTSHFATDTSSGSQARLIEEKKVRWMSYTPLLCQSVADFEHTFSGGATLCYTATLLHFVWIGLSVGLVVFFICYTIRYAFDSW